MQVLTRVYRVRPHELGKLTARVKKVQRSGVPVGANVGKGPRARYSLDQMFQLLVVLELAELSVSLNTASYLVHTFWPGSPLSLAPAHAWLMQEDGDDDSMLILATTAEIEGLSSHADAREAATARAGTFVVGAPARPMDGLRSVTLSSIMTDRKLDLSRSSLSQQLWRSSLIDCSTLVPIVAATLAETGLVSRDQLTAWAKGHCDAFFEAAEHDRRDRLSSEMDSSASSMASSSWKR
jgi:hypothetical protein